MNNLLFPDDLAAQSAGYQTLWLIIITTTCYCMLSAVIILVLLLIGYDLETLQGMDFETAGNSQLLFYKALQILSTIALFIAPAIAYSYVMTNNLTYLNLHKPLRGLPLVLGLFVSLAAFPIIGWTSQINAAIDLPPFLDNIETMMRTMEDEAMKMTIAFLQMNNPVDLLFNLVMVAVLPAIGEEMLFRGCLQRVFYRLFNNPHAAIWVAAALFSFIHFQFYGFLPRMVIGAVLGYLYYFSGNLWYPIIGHFLNNGIQVVAVYFYPDQLDNMDAATMDTIPFYFALLSLALIVYLLKTFKAQFDTNNTALH
jgi:membrane protease YdiL (CAAX protease family)